MCARRFSESATVTFRLGIEDAFKLVAAIKTAISPIGGLSGCAARTMRTLSRPFSLGTRTLVCGAGRFVHGSYRLGCASHLWYPLSTNQTPCLVYPQTYTAQPVNKPCFDVRRDNCLLILKPIPGTHYDNFHGNNFAGGGRIGALPCHGRQVHLRLD